MKKEKIGDRVRQLRDEYGLSQAEFAKEIGKSLLTVGNLERGETKSIQPATINNIINRFGTTREWLEDGDGEMLPGGKADLSQTQQGNPDLPWKNEAWTLAKDQISQKDQQLNNLLAFISKLDLGSFLHPVGKTG